MFTVRETVKGASTQVPEKKKQKRKKRKYERGVADENR